jgi:hypothetical protein
MMKLPSGPVFQYTVGGFGKGRQPQVSQMKKFLILAPALLLLLVLNFAATPVTPSVKDAAKAPAVAEPEPVAPTPVWPMPTDAVARYLGEKDFTAVYSNVTPAKRPIAPGDGVAYLMTVDNFRSSTQYIVEIIAAEPTAKERKHFQTKPIVRYSDDGTRVEYASRPIALYVKVVGPFSGNHTPQVRTTRLVTNLEGLTRNLVAASDTYGLLGRASSPLTFARKPFTDAEIAAKRAELTRAGLAPTPAEEENIGGIKHFLYGFFSLAMQTDGLSYRVSELAAQPPSLAMITGHKVDFAIKGDKVATLAATPGTPDHRLLPLAMIIDGKDAIDMDIYVREPEAPYAVGAGIEGIVARSIRLSDRVLYAQLIGATNALGK